MKFLRTASTLRLLSVIAGVVIAIIAGTAIAIAASGRGPVPVKKPLANAIRDAVAAPAPAGITARINFTNNLIPGSEIQNPGPLLGGGQGRLWLGANHQLRLEIQGENGDAQVVVNQHSFWIYDPQSNTVYRGTLPAQSGADKKSSSSKSADKLPTVAQIQSQLKQVAAHLSLSGAIPGDVAGRPTYTVRVSPRHSAGLLGRLELGWDALRGVPLRFAVYSSTQSAPVLALQVTHISYGKVKAGVFNIHPPSGAKVVKLSSPAGGSRAAHAKGSKRAPVTGAANVAKHLSFPLSAPATLDSLPQQSVQLLDWGGSPAALVTYGQNLGGIAVIEQKAQPKSSTAASSSQGGDHQQSFSPSSVKLKGASGQELDTAIGTVVTFTRAGVQYTVITSLAPQGADAAASGL